jgi:Ca2+-binding RTX toxin-like protein
MAKVVFTRGFDMESIPVSTFTEGEVDGFSNTQIHVTSGIYAATIIGENFFSGGTVHEAHGVKNGSAIFDITGLNVPVATLNADRDDAAALNNDLFGGADIFKGSKYADVIVSIGGDDKISGGRGADVLDGGAGADTMSGGAEADTFRYSGLMDSSKKSADLITDLDAGDTFDLSALDAASVKITSAYSEAKDVTAFSIDLNRDHTVDLVITASGDHTDFNLSHFVI